MNTGIERLPKLSISIDGSELTEKEMASLETIRVSRILSQSAQCELDFFELQGGFATGEKLGFGKMLKIDIEGSLPPLFEGEITAIEKHFSSEKGLSLLIRGYDLLHKLKKRQPVRAFVDNSLHEIIAKLAEGIDARIELSRNPEPKQKVFQYNQTDFELLEETTSAYGLYFALKDGALSVVGLEGEGEETQISYGSDLISAKIEFNSDNICGRVSTTGWDACRAEEFSAQAAEAFAASALPASYGNAGEIERAFSGLPLSGEAESLAISQGAIDYFRHSGAIFEGIVNGKPSLHPGMRVSAKGPGKQDLGTFVLTEVTHTIDPEQGFITRLSNTPPRIKRHHKHSFSTLGIVTRTDGPENFGRLCVKLPNYNNLETGPLQVLTPGAGIGKGLLALPDIDDTVLVHFPNGEITHGVILGGLYGMIQEDGFDWGIDKGRVKKYILQTPGGQKITIDDTRRALRLQNREGSYIDIAPGKVKLHSRPDLEISAPGKAIKIIGKTIDFEQG